MDKCKCIKKYDDPQVSFSENYFYDYDYIPTLPIIRLPIVYIMI